ncbi:MAG: hypothetical protein IKR81_17295 [Victivallales bacterium]|nr:hypothetical protein [Victivallales bacterium]
MAWFKCVTGLGDGRAKAQRLAQVVKESLLASAGITKDATLSTDIDRFKDATYSLSGTSLRDIAGRFKTAHADAITANEVRRDAYKIAEEVADGCVQKWFKGAYIGVNPERPEQCRNYIKKLALYSVQHLVQAADKREVLEDIRDRMRRVMEKVINTISTVEIMQACQGSGLGFPMTQTNRKGGFSRFDLDELHFRAILAALLTKDGPVKTPDFVSRIAMYQEEILQERKDALLSVPLDPPGTAMSGYFFAESASKAFKAAEDSEWHRQGL